LLLETAICTRLFRGWIAGRRVVQLHAGRIVYTSGRSVCDHPALPSQLDDRMTTAQSLLVTRHLQRQSVAILSKPACIWRFDEHDRNTGALQPFRLPIQSPIDCALCLARERQPLSQRARITA
jgi:hypothetical protein